MLRRCPGLLLLLPVVLAAGNARAQGEAGAAAADRYEWMSAMPGAKQSGPSCGLYANIPALTAHTGINIADGSDRSKFFIRSVYGLEKGDFRMRKPFGKSTLFSLFGLTTESEKHYLRGSGRRDLAAQCLGLVRGKILPELRKGHQVSARVTGRMNRPHNVLLMAAKGGRVLYHDPTPGKLRTMGEEKLAQRLLTKSGRDARQLKPTYYVHWVVVRPALTGSRAGAPAGVGELPENITVKLAEGMEKRITTALAPAVRQRHGAKDMPENLPGVTWASRVKRGRHSSLLSGDLTSAQHLGLVNIAWLALHAFSRETRDCLPVLVVGHVPYVVTGYRGGREPSLAMHDGVNTVRMPLPRVLAGLRKSETLKLGYLDVR